MTNTKIMTSLLVAAIVIISGTGYAVASVDSTQTVQNELSETEKNTIAKSITSYEVKRFDAVDTLADIDENQLTIEFKDQTYELRLIPDENLNNAEFYVEIDGENVLQTDNPTAYVGYIKDIPKSSVSLVISGDSVSGFVNTGDNEIAIEPLSFYGDFAGNKQIMYDMSDLDFEFSFEGDVETENEKIHPTSTEINEFWPLAQADSGHTADLIIDTDSDYYNINTSTCSSRVLTIVGAMNTEFATTDATFNVESINCNKSYLTSSSTPGNLDQLEDEYNGSGTTPSRDLIIAFLGDDKDYGHIGSASDDPGIDNVRYQGYAVAQMVDDSTTNYDASLTERKILATHEAGHVMGAHHTNGQISGDYTIMYGGTIDDSNLTLDFYSGSKTEINDAADDYL